MLNPDDMRDMFKHDPKLDARILNTVMPSDFFPAKGQYFRVRNATVADRSYMGDIWVCIESQDHCSVGKKVLDTYLGIDSKHIGAIKSFVAGDVIFYDCTQIWDAVLRDLENSAKAPPAPTSGSDVVESQVS